MLSEEISPKLRHLKKLVGHGSDALAMRQAYEWLAPQNISFDEFVVMLQIFASANVRNI